MIIALPAQHHEHLADALVRDLGFKRRHVDAPLRELLVKLDPFVDSGTAMANMGPSPRLSSKLEQMGGNSEEGRWERLLNPPRPGSIPDRVAAEVKRLLDVVRTSRLAPFPVYEGDVVVVGLTGRHSTAVSLVALKGRFDGDDVDHWIEDAGIVGEQDAIVNYVRELRQTKTYTVLDPGFYDGVGIERPPYIAGAEDLPGLTEDEPWSTEEMKRGAELAGITPETAVEMRDAGIISAEAADALAGDDDAR